MSGDTAERKLKRGVIIIITGIVICAALALFGFLHLWDIV